MQGYPNRGSQEAHKAIRSGQAVNINLVASLLVLNEISSRNGGL